MGGKQTLRAPVWRDTQLVLPLSMNWKSRALLLCTLPMALAAGRCPASTFLQGAHSDSSDFVDDNQLWKYVSGPDGQRDLQTVPLYQAVFSRNTEAVAGLLAQGVSPNALLYPKAWSPLMVAIAHNDAATTRVLIQHGANLNYVSDNAVYWSPLATALYFGRFYPNVDHADFSLFHELLNDGADVNLASSSSDVAEDAVTTGQFQLVNELLARGFTHDLPMLKRWLQARDPNGQEAQQKRALATINKKLADGANERAP